MLVMMLQKEVIVYTSDRCWGWLERAKNEPGKVSRW